MSVHGLGKGFGHISRLSQAGTPTPTPTGPLLLSDFQNASYLIAGSSVGVGGMWTENLDFGNFSPSDIEAGVGLHPAAHAQTWPTMTPAANAALLHGYVAVMYFFIQQVEGGSSLSVENVLLSLPGYDTYSVSNGQFDRLTISSSGSPVFTDIAVPVDGLYKIATRVTDTTLAASINGSDIITVAAIEDLPPTDVGVDVVRTDGDVLISKIEYYLPSTYADSDLPTLSTL